MPFSQAVAAVACVLAHISNCTRDYYQNQIQTLGLSSSLLKLLLNLTAAAAVALQLPADRRPSEFSWQAATGAAFVAVHQPQLFEAALAVPPAAECGSSRSSSRGSIGGSTGTHPLGFLKSAAAQLVHHMPGSGQQPTRNELRAAYWLILQLGSAEERVLFQQEGLLQVLKQQLQQAHLQPGQQLLQLLQALLPVVPRLAGVMQAAGRAGPGGLTWEEEQDICYIFQDFALALQTVSGWCINLAKQHRDLASPRLVVLWCSAGTAVLQSLPVAAAMAQREQQVQPGGQTEAAPGQQAAQRAEAAGRVARAAALLAAHATGACMYAATAATPRAPCSSSACTAAGEALWLFHTMLCRALHWQRAEVASARASGSASTSAAASSFFLDVGPYRLLRSLEDLRQAVRMLRLPRILPAEVEELSRWVAG